MDRFRNAGSPEVHVEEVTSYDWRPSNFGLHVGGTAVDAYPVAHSFIPADARPACARPARRSHRAVVDIGTGKIGGRDVRGKIVMFDLSFYLPTAGFAAVGGVHSRPRQRAVRPGTMLSANPFLTSLEHCA